MRIIAILTFLTTLVFAKSGAQTSKGNWMVGGDASYSYSKFQSELGQKNSSFEYSIGINGGFFLLDNFAAGVRTSLLSSGSKQTGTDRFAKYKTYNIGPFVRYYFLKPENQFNLLLDVAYQYGILDGGTKYPTSTYMVSGVPVIFLNNVVGIEFLFGYSSSKYTEYDGRNGTLKVSLGFQIHLDETNDLLTGLLSCQICLLNFWSCN